MCPSVIFRGVPCPNRRKPSLLIHYNNDIVLITSRQGSTSQTVIFNAPAAAITATAWLICPRGGRKRFRVGRNHR